MFLAYNLIGWNYWISSALNYIIGSVFSYFMNKYFTFTNKEKSVRQVLMFVVNITVCYILAYGLAKPVVAFGMRGYELNVQENVAMLVGMGVFVVLNYFGQRFIVFREDKKDE